MLLSFNVFAQDPYINMLAEGKTWHFIRWPNGKIHTEGIRGDSIVNGMTCKKYGYVNYDGSFSCTALFRQEGDRVYPTWGKCLSPATPASLSRPAWPQRR